MSDQYFRIRFPQFLHFKTPNTSHSIPRDFKQQFRGSLHSWYHDIRCRITDYAAEIQFRTTCLHSPFPIMHYVKIPQPYHSLTLTHAGEKEELLCSHAFGFVLHRAFCSCQHWFHFHFLSKQFNAYS